MISRQTSLSAFKGQRFLNVYQPLDASCSVLFLNEVVNIF